MAKTICTILGALFILVGLVGFAAPGLGGFHLSLPHNLIHLISGAVALYLGLKGTLSAARLFCIVFGIVYLLLGVGYLLGTTHSTPPQPDALGHRLQTPTGDRRSLELPP